jgi:hypothetical protein
MSIKFQTNFMASPYFVRVWRNANLATTRNVASLMDWSTAITNRASMWTIGDPTRLYAPVTGVYRVIVEVTWGNNLDGSVSNLYLFGAGTLYCLDVQNNSTTNTSQQAMALIALTAGQYVDVVVRWDYSSGSGLVMSYGFSPFFTMYLVRPSRVTPFS